MGQCCNIVVPAHPLLSLKLIVRKNLGQAGYKCQCKKQQC